MESVKRLTPLLAVLTFIAVVNTVLGGLHLIASGDPLHWDRLAISLAASLLLSAWALRRLRIHWRATASSAGGPPFADVVTRAQRTELTEPLG
jgi:hypothetical protein